LTDVLTFVEVKLQDYWVVEGKNKSLTLELYELAADSAFHIIEPSKCSAKFIRKCDLCISR